MIRLDNIYKAYQVGDISLPVLRGITLTIEEGEFVSIMGASGSGKTTLLNLIGCLDSIDEGSYFLSGEKVLGASSDQLAGFRSRHIGFVFQLFNLIPRITALRNVELPLIYAGISSVERKNLALEALENVGLTDRAHHVPAQLSGGQQQRVAIARALINRPRILVADEPTGSLDSTTSQEIMRLFQALNQGGMTIVMVTHEEEIEKYTRRIVRLVDGNIVS
ncbi:MAG: ABC transporter ATP-binding protein [Methylococcales bacterium]|nr:ABC transporter ATP-binding protein [Methylococcales bacterium]